MADSKQLALLVQAQDALEHGDLKKGQSLVTQALKASPHDRDALMLQAVIHASNDKLGEAVRALDDALKHHPDDFMVLTSKASFLLDHADDAAAALPLLEHATGILEEEGRLDGKDADPELRVLAEEAYLLLSEAQAMLRNYAASLDAAKRAVELAPHDPAAHLMLATSLLDENRLDDAIASAKRALKEDASLADAHWLIARAHWMRGQDKDADAALDATLKLDEGKAFYKPLRTDKETIVRLHRQALAELPAKVGGPLSQIAISVEDAPTPAQLSAHEPHASATVLGLYEGKGMTLADHQNPLEHLPARVTLFRRNLEWMVRTQRELQELIIGTVMHEVARYQGVDLGSLDEKLA